jgi:L-threonylcarbamoyladenylate synthase
MSAEIERAVGLLRAGELVAFPTETVYGLGADAANPAAVAKIFAAKGRPQDHPLIVHLPDAAQLDAWARDVPEAARRLAAAFWPGPLTLILRRRPGVSDAITGGQDTVGLRVPNHPLALELLRAFGGGLAAPSANRFGRISPTTAQHVRDELGAAVAMVLDGGACAVGIESTILDLSGPAERGPAILRPGMIGAEAIAAVLGAMPAAGTKPGADAPRVSGSLDSHYAPATPLELVSSDGLVFAVRNAIVKGERTAFLASMEQPIHHDLIAWRLAPAEPQAFARALYASLRELDALGCARMVVQQPPQTAPWLPVLDRLRRAAAGG